MTDPTTTAPAPLGLVARFIGVITAPTATFRNVVDAPRPVGILFIAALLMGIGSIVPQFTESGRRAILDTQVKQMERMGMTITPELYEQMETSGRSTITKVMGFGSWFVMLPVISLIFAVLYWAIFNTALGGLATFKQVLAVVTHSNVISALGVLAALPVQLMTNTFNLAGPFNLAALVPMMEDGSMLKNTLGFISVFGLWGCIVTGIGLGVLYRRSARNISIALISVYVLFFLAVSAVMSSFTSRAA